MRVIARLGVLLCACGLGSCIFYPTRVDVYDSECQITTHRLELDVAMLDLNHACPSGDEETCLLVVAAIGPASAVVSGSIVVIGNTIYWLERQGRCRYDFT